MYIHAVCSTIGGVADPIRDNKAQRRSGRCVGACLMMALPLAAMSKQLAAAVKPGVATVKLSTAVVKPGTAVVKNGTTAVNHGASAVKGGAAVVKHGSDAVKRGTAAGNRCSQAWYCCMRSKHGAIALAVKRDSADAPTEGSRSPHKMTKGRGYSYITPPIYKTPQIEPIADCWHT